MKTLVEGIALLLIGAGALWGALQIPPPAPGEIGAGLFPVLISASLLVIGGAMVLGGLRAGGDGGSPSRRQLAEVGGLSVVSLAYWWGIGAIGYLLATAIAAPLALAAFDVRKPLALGLAAVICPLVYHLIFFEALGVFPPYGAYFDLLEVVRGS